MFVSALPGESTTSEISLFYPMRCDCLINVTRKTHFVYISDTVADISSSWPFLTACSKIAWSVGPLCEHRQGNVFSIHWQQYW